ncbi:hypothetical protein NEOLEDRAFT_1131616 [Neolentinus lepideus HHB14362 ss-1]|uniref:Uncharacterized protein n=1 Tax=Neolentinus lepideus HHB14362 ss-1 TaxID=1314782 RepID=A0A165TRV2_9AGAM|nr:hypothetical protein NEOLEDRAFT_1131616 [Neolentinus lepideus HHB14362 ss-1]
MTSVLLSQSACQHRCSPSASSIPSSVNDGSLVNDLQCTTNSTSHTSPDLEFISGHKQAQTPGEDQDVLPNWTILQEEDSDGQSEALTDELLPDNVSNGDWEHGRMKKPRSTRTNAQSKTQPTSVKKKRTSVNPLSSTNGGNQRSRLLFDGVIITTTPPTPDKNIDISATPSSRSVLVGCQIRSPLAESRRLHHEGSRPRTPAITSRKRKREPESEDDNSVVGSLDGRHRPSSSTPDVGTSRSRSADPSTTPQPISLVTTFNAAAPRNKPSAYEFSSRKQVPVVEIGPNASPGPSPQQRVLHPHRRSSELRSVDERPHSVLHVGDAHEKAAPVRLQKHLREQAESEDALISMNTRWLRQALENQAPPKMDGEEFRTRVLSAPSKAVRFMATLEESFGPGTRVPNAVNLKSKKGILKAPAANERDKSSSPVAFSTHSKGSSDPPEGSPDYQVISVTGGRERSNGLSGHANIKTALPSSAGESGVNLNPKESNENIPGSSSKATHEWIAAIQRLVKGKVASTRQDLIHLSSILQHINERKEDTTVLQDTRLWASIALLGELPGVPFDDEHSLRGRATALQAHWQSRQVRHYPL